MGLVDIGRMRRALVQETRGRYIGDVDPDVFVEEFMGWNNGTSKSFRLKQPSETRVSCLVGMASKHESGMNKDWQIALSGWPPVRKQDKIQSLDFEDTHDCRDAETHLGPDSCIYFRARPIVPRHTRRKVDFANVQSFTEHKASDKMDAFVDGGDEDYDGGTYYVMAGYSKRKGGAEEGEKEDEDEKEGEGEEEREAGTREEPYIADSPAAADVDADGGEAHPEVVEDREPTPSENYPFENNTKQAGMKAVEMMRKYATSYFTGQHADFYKKESNPNQLPLLSLVLGEDTYVVPAPYFDGAMYSPFAFDLYVSEDGQADVGTEYKAGSIVKGGPEVKFDIRAITFLIRELSGFFAPRYIKTYDMTAAELELMSEEDLAEYEKEKEQHRQKLAKLLDPTSDFVCKTMRRWAAKMPEPPDNVTQWVDNMKGQGGLLKRSGNHMASAREKMSLRCDGRVSFKSADTRPSTPLD
ncbi:hypothetical protein EYR36_004139 [Pleurotus pulmonarius]|nr:hypothetical protein EYR36_004139 [Pleurotus pulmonarius]